MAVSPAHGVQCGGDAHKGTHTMFIFEPQVLYAQLALLYLYAEVARPRRRLHSMVENRLSCARV